MSLGAVRLAFLSSRSLQRRLIIPAAHAAQAPALREMQGITAKANKLIKT
jgi:hypothetical protein